MFYKIRTPLHTNGKGHVSKLPKKYDSRGEKSIYQLHNYDESFPNEIDIFDFPLNLSVPLKSVLCFIPISILNGIVIHDEAISFLSKFKVFGSRHYPVTLLQRKETNTKYKYLHCTMYNIKEDINFKKSIFWEENVIKLQPLHVKSFSNYQEIEHYEKEIHEDNVIVCTQLCLKSNSNVLNYDLIRIGPYLNSILVSQNLKNEFEKEGLTGLEFNPVPISFD